MRLFRFFESLLLPTARSPESAPPAGLLAFYWHYARQARGLLAVVVAGMAVTHSDGRGLWPDIFYAAAFHLALIAVLPRVDTVVLGGATTSGCIRATAIDLLQYGWPGLVPRECVGDRAQAPHRLHQNILHLKLNATRSRPVRYPPPWPALRPAPSPAP